MGLIVLQQLEAKPRTMMRDGRCVEVKSAAFVGATDGELCEFGIGLLDENSGRSVFWALVCPHLLITAWRGMHILDKTTSILHGTICHAYYAGQTNDENSDVKKAIAELSEQIPDFQAFRKSILEMKIDNDVLDAMLKICNSTDNSIDISEHELKEAVKAGIINQTDEVSRVYEIAIEQQLQRERIEQISKQPLPESKSFRVFCQKFGIKNLFDNPYDDWPDYWSVDKMDEMLVRSGLSYDGLESVWCAENPKSAPGVGHVGRPVLQLNDQRTVVLSYVRFKDNDMFGAIHSVKGEDEDEWLTLSELSAFKPRFVGLTFDRNDKPTPNDMARGYFVPLATGIKHIVQNVMNAVRSS